MTATDLSAVTAALTDLVASDLQAITFKWVARHFNIPYDTSKKVLFEFLSKQGQKVRACFLLSGWTKDASPRHVVRIVDGNSLDEAKAALGVITALHVYSVQPSEAKDADKLQNTEYVQSEEMFRRMLASTTDPNPLSANLLSTVRCPAAKRDASLVRAVPKKPASTSAAPIKAAAKPAPPTAPKPVSKARSPAKKAPAKPNETIKSKKAVEEKKKKASSPSAIPAEPKSKKLLIVDESDDDDEDELPSSAAAAELNGGAAKNAKKRATIDDFDSDEEIPDAKETEIIEKKKTKAPAAAAAGEKKKTAGNKRKIAEKQDDEEATVAKEEAAKKEAKLPSPMFGMVKVRTDVPTGKRTRRVMKTFYNDSGEEVTEMIEETDDEAPSPSPTPAVAAPAPAPAATLKTSPKGKKPSVGAGAGASKKASAKGAPVAGQRSIAAFFGKK